MFLSVVIPAYNEEIRLPATLATTADYFYERYPENFEILVVDDGSSDGTAKVVEEYAQSHPHISCKRLEYGGNRGKGFAVRYGILRGAGEWRLFCDADLATPVEEFDIVFEAMKASKADIGIGSRPLRDSQLIVHQPWFRELLGRTFNKAVQLLAVSGIDDTQCGFKIFSAASAQDIFSRCRLDGFAFDIEALLVARKLGYTIAEVPIRWSHKDGSKVNMVRDGSRMLCDLVVIRFMHARTSCATRPADSPPVAKR
jgi:dolichyl-phosphate beta-glucosyltransferase